MLQKPQVDPQKDIAMDPAVHNYGLSHYSKTLKLKTDSPDALLAHVVKLLTTEPKQKIEFESIKDATIILIELLTCRNVEIERSIFDDYINYYLRCHISYLWETGILYTFKSTHISRLLPILFKKFSLTSAQFISLLNGYTQRTNTVTTTLATYLEHVSDMDAEQTALLLTKLIDIPQSHRDVKDDLIFKVLDSSDKFKYNSESIGKLCKAGKIKIIAKMIQNKTFKPVQADLYAAFQSGNLELCKLLLMFCKLDARCLNLACKYVNDHLVEFVLQNKISPTKETFKSIFEGEDLVSKYNYTSRQNNRLRPPIINMIIQAGYVLTYDDVVLATRNFVKIDNIENYDIKLDGKFSELCIEIGFYPYDISKIDMTMECLRIACKKSGNLHQIRQIIKTYKFTPDNICLENASMHKQNIQTINFLIDHGAKPTLKCLQNCAAVVKNRTMVALLNHFAKDYVPPVTEPKNTKDAKDTKDTKDAKKTTKTKKGSTDSDTAKKRDTMVETIQVPEIKKGKTIDIVVAESSDESDDDKIDKIPAKLAVKNVNDTDKLSSTTKTESHKKDSSSDESGKVSVKSAIKNDLKIVNDDNDIEDSKAMPPKTNNGTDKKVTKVTKKVSKKKVSSSESESSSDESVDTQILINKQLKKHVPKETPVVVLKNIPADYDFRALQKISPAVSKILSVKPGEYTFFDTRKALMKTIATGGLAVGNSLTLNGKMCGLLGLPNNSKYDLTDIDKLLYNMIISKVLKVHTPESDSSGSDSDGDPKFVDFDSTSDASVAKKRKVAQSKLTKKTTSKRVSKAVLSDSSDDSDVKPAKKTPVKKVSAAKSNKVITISKSESSSDDSDVKPAKKIPAKKTTENTKKK